MPHHFSDIAIVIFLAAICAVFFSRLKQLPMIGYVVAGVLIGPSVLGVIAEEENINFFAEIGIILLLFILGMELPLKTFRATAKPALLCTAGLVAMSLGLMAVIGLVLDLTLAEKIVYGFIISLSSTAVAVKLLEEVDLLAKGPGQIALSVLIAQDLVFVPMMIIVGALGQGGGFDWVIIPKMLGAVGVLVALILYLSRKERIFLPFHKTVDAHKDLIPVAALAFCFGGAALSELSGLSPAYGAFLAGLIIGNSHSKEHVLPKIEPMQNVLLMVFFLSIGMLIDFDVIAKHAGLIAALLIGSMVFKTLLSITLLKALLPADRWRCSFVTGLTISQIGEFSFILAAAALANGIFHQESYKVIIAVIALSLALSPVWMSVLTRFVQIAFADKSAQCMTSALARLFGRPARVAAE